MMAEFDTRPISFEDAARWVNERHRHLPAPIGHKFSIAAVDRWGRMFGVVMVGRPVARHQDDGMTLEVNRCCTDGTKNACSFLYAAAARAAKALGYARIITYTLDTEPGTSLRAVGWYGAGNVRPEPWDRPARQRRTPDLVGGKLKWHKALK